MALQHVQQPHRRRVFRLAEADAAPPPPRDLDGRRGRDLEHGAGDAVQPARPLRPLFRHPAADRRQEGCRLPIEIRVDNPAEVGPDRLVNTIAAFERYGGEIIVVDFGTATTLDVVARDGAYIGGAIAPGVNLSLDALHHAPPRTCRASTSAMPAARLGRNTVHCMQSGIFWGYVGLIEGIASRIAKERGHDMRLIATGGLSPLFARGSDMIQIVDPDLTMRGLVIIHDFNKRKQDGSACLMLLTSWSTSRLGGAGEIGMNCYLYGYGAGHARRWIMVDFGLGFGDMDTAPGVEVMVPDIEFLVQERERIEGIVLTHAHEDHIGAIQHLWDKLRVPIHARPFTAEVVRRSMGEAGLDTGVIRQVGPGQRARLGPFEVEWLPVTHSIPEASCLAIRTASRHGRPLRRLQARPRPAARAAHRHGAVRDARARRACCR